MEAKESLAADERRRRLEKLTSDPEVIRLRREGKRPVVPDLLQLMLDAQKVSSKGGENDSQPAITDKQLVANAFFSMAAGYETTATMMGFILYELARHPEEQDRIYDEMTALLNSQSRCGSESCDSNGHSELNYEQLQSLRRLDAVLCECLRMYPPIVSFIDRNCNRDITIKGCHIPAGMGIMVHVWHVHHDPDFWPDPYRFDPDRFYVQPTSDVKDPSGTFSSTSRHQHHPGSYLPFGLGPRECLGRRFAILELKMMVTKIVQRYRLALPEEEGNKGGIKIKARALLIHPATDIKLLVRKRNAN